MIHPSARRAVGWIGPPDKLHGHAILVGPRHAITCAHVISDQKNKPDDVILLRFPNLNLETTASVALWRAYDPMLTAGTDIAILTLDDESRVPADSWVRLQPERPPIDAPVATLDFLTARKDGDGRRAEVHDRHGAVISVRGEHLIEPGMSGTGLFQTEPGERLLGLVSGRPRVEGQTAGYVIPADEIVPLLAEFGGEEAGTAQTFFPNEPEAAGRAPPGLLLVAPYYCDRTTQRLRFQMALSQRLSMHSGLPLYTVVSGPEEQCTDMLVQQMYTEDLPRVLERNRRKPLYQSHVLYWPKEESGNLEGDLETLRSGLYDTLDLGWPLEGDAPLQDWLALTPSTLVLRLTLDVHNWRDRDEALLAAWLSWWSGIWQDRSHPVLIFIRLTSSPGFFKRFYVRSRTRTIHDAFRRISTSVGQDHSLLLLDELQGVTLSDIEKWLNEADVLDEAGHQRNGYIFYLHKDLCDQVVSVEEACGAL